MGASAPTMPPVALGPLTSDGFYSPNSWSREELEAMARKFDGGAPFRAGQVSGLDIGIVRAVKVLTDAGVETFESCEGGGDHSFPEPTVRFHGGTEAGWRALAVCLAYGFPVLALRRYWTVGLNGEPDGPSWELVFRRKLD